MRFFGGFKKWFKKMLRFFKFFLKKLLTNITADDIINKSQRAIQ